MKKILTLLMIIGLVWSAQIQAQVSISTTCNDPDASAMLDVQSTDKGMLVPRMTSTEMGNVASPATGLLVFNTTANTFYYFDGTNWVPFDTDTTDGDAWAVTGEDQVSNIGRTGSVGIGLNSPAHTLHIYGTSNNAADVYSETDASRIVKHWFVNATQSWSIGQIGSTSNPHNSFRIIDETAGESRIAVTPAGNVGIGTTEPAEELSIQGSVVGGDLSTSTATGDYSFSFGDNCDATGNNSVVGGGKNNTASGWLSTIAGGEDNISSGTISSILGGFANEATGTASTVLGGRQNQVSGKSSAAGGKENIVTSDYGFTMGLQNNVNGDYGVAFGQDVVVDGEYGFGVGQSVHVYGNHSVAFGLSLGPVDVHQSGVLAIMGGSVGIGTTTPDGVFNIQSILDTAAFIVKSDGRIGVGIVDPDPSAIFEINANTQGFLPPRVDSTESVSSPAAGLIIFDLEDECMKYFNGNEWSDCMGNIVPAPPKVTSAGEVWMDRNLGASQQATSSTDSDAYGDLYQWGRDTEGHEKRSSSTSTTNATTAEPNQGNSWDGKFIIEGSSPYDWLATSDNSLWQGVSGTNNPCPTGYRLPTRTEWETERTSWSSNNSAGAYDSPLKLTLAGYRQNYNGNLTSVDSEGHYATSTLNGNYAYYLKFTSSTASSSSYDARADGYSVRCIKD